MNLSTPSMLDAPARSAERILRWIETAGVFLLGVVLMNYLYAASAPLSGGKVGTIGLPEYDSWYHVAMASMLPEHGLIGKLEWLEFAYFRDQGSDFVSHHWGFHLLLMPFVKLSEWITGNSMAGGRWAMSAVLGANLALFHLLLRQRRVPLHWLWIAAFLLLPDQFFARQGYVRAIGSSLLFMQLILLTLFSGRVIWTAIVLACYVHLYLGAVMFGPILVALYALSLSLGAREDRQWPVRLTLITAAGWLVGVVTYPYAAGMWEFLRLQVFGTGLSPDIEVGREWKPYTDAWVLPTMAGPLLVTWIFSLVLRLRMGPRLDARELSLVLIQFVFLALTFKARRFIEYWPIMCLLSSAYLATPPLQTMLDALGRWWIGLRGSTRAALTSVSLAGSVALAIAITAVLCGLRMEWSGGLSFHWRSSPDGLSLGMEWPTWTAVAAILLLPALARIWSTAAIVRGNEIPLGRVLGVVAGGAVLLGSAWLATRLLPSPLSTSNLTTRLAVPGVLVGLIVAGYLLIPVLIRRAQETTDSEPRSAVLRRSAVAVLVAIFLPAITLAVAAPSLGSASRQLKANFNVADVSELMAYLKSHSNPGDIVFTDDWDVFPLFFFFNRHNHYIVGLDPKFTHARDPDLWNRYVKISRGEVPTTIRLASNAGVTRQATVDVTDIRTHFRARYVVADRDHRRLADSLHRRPDVAEFVFPAGAFENHRNAPYLVFRIRAEGETPASASAPAKEASEWPAYLSRMKPFAATQGWGDLGSDRSVDGNRLAVRGRRFERGLGTHAPARLTYQVPAGATHFECLAGIDDETDGHGSAELTILLDGRVAFRTPTFRSGDEPIPVRVPLHAAAQLLIQLDTGTDGQRFDHVDLAEARFTRETVQ